MDVRKFIEMWGDNKRANSRDWTTMVLAEMRTSATAFLVGILIGTSENKDCITINRKLAIELGMKAECSWQNIRQDGITNELWSAANKKAEGVAPKGTSQHTRAKYAWAPTATHVYVSDERDVTRAKQALMKKYGKEVDNTWQQWPDGSRAKFVPRFEGTIKNEKGKKQLKDRIEWQIQSKATETIYEFPVKDIHEEKSYLGGKSIEQLILSKMSEANPTLAIFKNIVHKWMRSPEVNKWQITAHNRSSPEVVSTLVRWQEKLVAEYGEVVHQHFEQGTSLRDTTPEREEVDNDEMTQWMQEDDNMKYEQMLEPGFPQMLTEVNKVYCSMSTIAGESEKSDSVESVNDSSIDSNSTNRTEVSAVSWDRSISTKEKDSVDWRSSSRIQKKLDKANITGDMYKDFVANIDPGMMKTIGTVYKHEKHKIASSLVTIMIEEQGVATIAPRKDP